MRTILNYEDFKMNEALSVKKAEAMSLDDFIYEFTQKYNSAIDVWMEENKKKDLFKKYKSDKHVFKNCIIDSTPEDAKDKIKEMKNKGWKVFDKTENVGQTEVLFFKNK